MPTLDFKGKQHIYAHHLTVPYRTLEPDASRSLKPTGADDNLIIHGDNLQSPEGPAAPLRRPRQVHLHRPALQHRQRGLGL